MRIPRVRFTVRRLMVAVAAVTLLASAGRTFIPRSCLIRVSMRDRSFRFITFTPEGAMKRYLILALDANAIRIESTTNSRSDDGVVHSRSRERRLRFR